MEAPGLKNGAEGESRTRTGVAHCPLKTACLPIPPLRQTFFTAVAHSSQLAFLVVQRLVLQSVQMLEWLPVHSNRLATPEAVKSAMGQPVRFP